MIKSIARLSAAILLAGLTLASCSKDGVKYLSSNVTIDESGLAGAPSPESYKVTFTNTTTEEVVEVESEGVNVLVEKLTKGVYDVVAQAQFSYAGYAYNYIGTARNVTVDTDGFEIVVKVAATKAAALVVKEVYYNSCKDDNNANLMKDFYLEIYNNSDQVVYADGIALAMTCSPLTYEWKYEAGAYTDKEGNTFDVGIANDDQYVFLTNTVWQIPGKGSDYPVAPGESVVIAGYAMDHTTVAKESINLSTADFETYCDHYGEKGQVDCKAINMNLVAPVVAPTNNFWLTVTGRGFVIFHQDAPIRGTDFIRSSNYPTSLGLEVLKSDVIDAVDLVANATTKKWVDETLDAGKVLSQGNYCGNSVLRKVASTTEDGRVILQDTNNSTEDFITCEDASLENKTKQIRRFGAGRPSWSTWTTAQ